MRRDPIANDEPDPLSLFSPPGHTARLFGLVALACLLPVCLIASMLSRNIALPQPASTIPKASPLAPLEYSWGGATPYALNVRGAGFASDEQVLLHAAPSMDASLGAFLPLATPQAARDGTIWVRGIDLGENIARVQGWVLIARGASSGHLATAGPLSVPALPTATPLPTPTPVPTLTPQPLPSPTAAVFTPDANALVTQTAMMMPTPDPDLWYEDYFPNRDFFGPPVFSRYDTPTLFYKWGRVPPSPALAINNFSAIFTRTVTFPYTGTVLFELQVTGAARMSINGGVVIDEWYMGPYRRQVQSYPVLGGVPYQIKVEYYNSKHTATICLEWRWGEFTGWQGRYYASDGVNPIMPPLMIRNDDQINFVWGFSSPGLGVPADNFSVIWTRSVNFPASGQYRFVTEVDDWMRVFIDGKEIPELNNFGGRPGRREAIVKLRKGKHYIEVRYTEKNIWAAAKFYWEFIITVPTRTPEELCTGPGC